MTPGSHVPEGEAPLRVRRGDPPVLGPDVHTLQARLASILDAVPVQVRPHRPQDGADLHGLAPDPYPYGNLARPVHPSLGGAGGHNLEDIGLGRDQGRGVVHGPVLPWLQYPGHPDDHDRAPSVDHLTADHAAVDEHEPSRKREIHLQVLEGSVPGIAEHHSEGHRLAEGGLQEIGLMLERQRATIGSDQLHGT